MGALWVLLYVSMATWSDEAFARYVALLGRSVLVQVIFVYFLCVLAVNIIRFFLEWLTAGDWLALLWMPFLLGMLLFLGGFFLSAVFATSGRAVVGEGQMVQPPWESRPYIVGRVDTGVMNEITFTEDGEGFLFAYAPRVYLDRDGRRHEVGAFPPTRIGGAYYHILDFGLAPGVRLLRGGVVVDEHYAIQKLLPPGVRDSFEIEGLPYRITLKLLPVRTMRRGDASLSVYDPRVPRYEVVVQRGPEIVFSGESTEPVALDEVEIQFFAPGQWVWIEGSQNPGMLPLALGVALVLGGVPMIFLLMSARVLAALGRGKGSGPEDGAPALEDG
jgi:hypothetical protein